VNLKYSFDYADIISKSQLKGAKFVRPLDKVTKKSGKKPDISGFAQKMSANAQKMSVTKKTGKIKMEIEKRQRKIDT